eukprot:11198827-Lingulodinium_polyedra.AAC.1
MQMSMYRAAGKRLFYLWTSFIPWDLDDGEGGLLINHVPTQFNLYYRPSPKDLGSDKLVDLYLITNDMNYGALVELDDSCDDRELFSAEPIASDLS